MSLGSALLLGTYDVAKKEALKRNGTLPVLLVATALSALFLCPFLSSGSMEEHLHLALKAAIVTTSWVSGMIGLKLLPITTVSTLKASRPFFVVLFSVILFGEKLNLWQWSGVALALLALTLLSGVSRQEGIRFLHSKGFYAMLVSILSGVASALYDKHIMQGMEPLFVQSWTNIYITLLLAACMSAKILYRKPGRKEVEEKKTEYGSACEKEKSEGFRWDWMLVIIAVLITAADMLYFFALKQEDALLSVISLLRRCSVAVTFALGAILFREKKIKEKALDLAILMAGMFLLLYGSGI